MKMESLGSRRDREATVTVLHAADTNRDGVVAELNRVKITGPQMRAAIETIQHVQVRSKDDAREHARLLKQFAADYGFTPAAVAGTALHARAIAMDRWCHRYDPHGQTDIDAFYEAGARAPMIDSTEGPMFEPKEFGELVQFYAEMPF